MINLQSSFFADFSLRGQFGRFGIHFQPNCIETNQTLKTPFIVSTKREYLEHHTIFYRIPLPSRYTIVCLFFFRPLLSHYDLLFFIILSCLISGMSRTTVMALRVMAPGCLICHVYFRPFQPGY